MRPRARKYFISTPLALALIACASPGYAHNGRDLGRAVASAVREATIFSGITITTNPRTGVRTYTQTGDIPPNPGRATANPVATTMEHGVDFWVAQSLRNDNRGGYYADAPPRYAERRATEYPSLGYGGYLPIWGYDGGNRPGPPGHFHGNELGGPPDRPGGGIGSPPPYPDAGVGAPPPTPTSGFNGYRSRSR